MSSPTCMTGYPVSPQTANARTASTGSFNWHVTKTIMYLVGKGTLMAKVDDT